MNHEINKMNEPDMLVSNDNTINKLEQPSVVLPQENIIIPNSITKKSGNSIFIIVLIILIILLAGVAFFAYKERRDSSNNTQYNQVDTTEFSPSSSSATDFVVADNNVVTASTTNTLDIQDLSVFDKTSIPTLNKSMSTRNISSESDAETFLTQKIEEQKKIPKTDLILCGKKYRIQSINKMFGIDVYKRIAEIANYDRTNNICADMEKYYYGKELGVYTYNDEDTFSVHFYELYDKHALLTSSSGADSKLGFSFITYWNSVSYFYPGLVNGQARFVGIINGWMPNPNMSLLTQDKKDEILNGIQSGNITKTEDCYTAVYVKYIMSSYPGDKELGNAMAEFCISKVK
jgi:hypothetical protein